MDEKLVYTVKELSALLGVSPATIYDMAWRRQIPGRRLRGVNSKWVFPKAAIDAWLAGEEPAVRLAACGRKSKRGGVSAAPRGA